MQKRSSTKRGSRDMNVIASRIVNEATSREIPMTKDGKNVYAVELGRRGGLKGGVARAERLTAEQRKEIAQKAARARWQGKNE